MAEEFRTTAPGIGDTMEKSETFDRSDASLDLLRVALAAYAAHLDARARVRIPGAMTPWGRSARIANLRPFHTR
jgi:hypothetical protein